MRNVVRIAALGALLLGAAAAARGGGGPGGTPPPDSHLRVDANRVLNRNSPWMYGSCIEDVNHEIYGGLYSQMLFGESFEEPPSASPAAGWSRFGGDWRVEDGICRVAADFGAKLVRDSPALQDGMVACDVRFDEPGGDNVGLILRVADPRPGADSWTGYEISLSLLRQAVILGRHRNNWEPLRTAALPIAGGRWYRLQVTMDGPVLRIAVDGRPVLDFTDREAPLPAGRVGLRTWGSAASFRGLTVDTGRRHLRDTFPAPTAQAGSGTVSGMWDGFQTAGARAQFTWDDREPFNTRHSQRIELSGEGTGVRKAGVANRGLNRWGLTVRRGHRYLGSVYLRGAGYHGAVTVALQSADGSRTYATRRLAGIGPGWRRHPFTLRSEATDTNARFAVWIDAPGAVWVDQAVLMPSGSERFRGLPVRAEIGDALVREGLTFLRYGGTMVNAPEYRWKKMIGDPDRRPQYRGHWYPYSTNGFGIEEFLRFCEAAHFEPVFAINIEETDRDAADLVEYLNGPVTSAWGRRRAENGHEKPYGVRYIEIGNEEGLDGSAAWYERYRERFRHLYAAMQPVDPNLQLVIAAWWKPEEPLVRRIFEEANGKAALWDVHVGGDGLRDGQEADRVLTGMQRLFRQWAPGTEMKACVFEENGNRHDLQRALGHASILNATQRHGDFVRMDCPANCLQPWRQNDNGWDQGQLFFTSGQVWGMPPYYAQQMAAERGPWECVSSTCRSPGADLDLLALRGPDGRRLTVRVVNLGERPHPARIELAGARPRGPKARLSELTGDLLAVNSPEAPRAVVPAVREVRVDSGSPAFNYSFPPHSLTIFRFELERSAALP